MLVGVVGAVLLGPRLKSMVMQGDVEPSRRDQRRAKTKLSGAMRLAIVVSLLLPAAAAVYFEPWHHNVRPFLYIGVGPLIAGWSTWWIARGFRDS